MRTILRIAAAASVAALAVLSCSKNENPAVNAGGEGYLMLNLSFDGRVTTKAVEDSDPIFKITVRDLNTGETVKVVEDHHTLEGAPISLAEGSYIIDAENGEDVVAAFGAPYYKGSDTVEIVAGETAASSIVCTMANVKVTVSVTDNVTANFPEYAVTVSNGMQDGALEFAGATSGSEGYFRCTGSLLWTINLTNADGEKFSQSGEISNVSPRDYYNLNFDISNSSTEGGSLTLTLTVDGTLNDKDHYIDITDLPVQNMEVVTERVNAWAKSVYVYGKYTTATQPEGLGIQYRKEGEGQWTDFSGEMTVDGASVSAKITGLEPATKYEARIVSALDARDDNAVSFTTEEAAQLPNFNFDTWTESGHFPNADKDANYFWDSGNEGASIMSKYPTSQETSFVVSGSAAKLASQFVGVLSFGQFAGGNIYSGAFVGLVGTDGAQIDFGRPYTSRPSALHGWYSYAPVPIDYVKSPYESLKGTSDICQIYVVLTDWTEPFRVNNATGVLFSPDDPAVIAYGTLEDNVGTGGEYKEFTINLEYRDLERKPTYVLLVAAASKYADYFTGGNGSVMYIDEFEFIFE